MTIDLSKAKAGDVVKFFCGVTDTITYAGNFTLEPGARRFEFEKYAAETFHSDGRPWVGAMNSTHRIVSITPKPFNWHDVKAGMAFISDELPPSPLWYVGKHLTDDSMVVMAKGHNGTFPYNGLGKRQLTRAPEHDLVQP